MFGFRLPENFNRPYSAVSITDFWRRWHMSLTRFFRDYVYIPLGGNRFGEATTYRNLLLVFVLCGLWHGAAWTFLAWGLYHGIWLIVERITGTGRAEPTSCIALRRLGTLVLVMIGWVFFRTTSLPQAGEFLHAMIVPRDGPLALPVALALNNRNVMILLLAGLVAVLPRNASGARLIVAQPLAPWALVRMAAIGFLVLYAVGVLASATYNPFLYFRF
jgi:alginate O-acetyltransferase complex protein AlgI